jgi:hypothetical protein
MEVFMKINQIFFLISTCFAILPMNAQAVEGHQLSSLKMRTGSSNLRQTETEIRRDHAHRMSGALRDIRNISEERRTEIYRASLALADEQQYRIARQHVPLEVLEWFPKELLKEIDFQNSDTHLETGQRLFRLGLKAIDYHNLLLPYMKLKLEENRQFITEHKDTHPLDIINLVQGFRLTEEAPLPEATKQTMLEFIYSTNPTFEHLTQMHQGRKNRHLSLLFMKAGDHIEKASTQMTRDPETGEMRDYVPLESKADCLFSAALCYKWAADRLEANWENYLLMGGASSAREPFHYRYYRKALEMHTQARAFIPQSDKAFKEKYLRAVLENFFKTTKTRDTDFLANPMSVLPDKFKESFVMLQPSVDFRLASTVGG